MGVKICTFYLHFFGKKDFYIARKSNIADVENIAFIGLFFILSNPAEFPCQHSLPTPVSLSVIPTKLASLAINVYFYCCQCIWFWFASLVWAHACRSFVTVVVIALLLLSNVFGAWYASSILDARLYIYLFLMFFSFICISLAKNFPRGLIFAYIRLLMHFFLYISARENLCIFCGLSKKNAKYIYIICNDKTLWTY